MKVKVVRPFNDKFNLAREYKPGEIVDFEVARAEDIVSRGLGKAYKEAPKVEKVEEPKVEKVETPKVEEPKDEAPVVEEAKEEIPEEEKESNEQKPKRGRKKKE